MSASILNLVVRAESYAVRGHIWEAFEAGQRNPRVTDPDLRGYHRPEPGWIAEEFVSYQPLRRFAE
jgi:hypothetical protein